MSRKHLTTAVIFDIDGTLANCDHRRHLVQHIGSFDQIGEDLAAGKKKDWAEFFRLSRFDTVHEPIRKLLNMLWQCNHIVLCTGRDETQRETTVEWLSKHGIHYSALYMRPAQDYRKDAIVKLELLAEIRKFYEPWLVVDDRTSVVNMWRAAGLTCLQCAPGDF